MKDLSLLLLSLQANLDAYDQEKDITENSLLFMITSISSLFKPSPLAKDIKEILTDTINDLYNLKIDPD